jgi:hypothetical protein
MYLYCGMLFSSPTYLGWLVLCFSSFGSLKRIKKNFNS